MDSENIEKKLQEGGQSIAGATVIRLSAGIDISLDELANLTMRTKDFLRNPFTLNTTRYIDRPLLLSDLMCLMESSSETSKKDNIRTLFNNIPLAQYKHLPDPRYLLESPRIVGGNIVDEPTLDEPILDEPTLDESTLETQEVSLPSETKEEELPSLDIVESSSIGGSYKRSSHKKRKSTRIRTKKNKKL